MTGIAGILQTAEDSVPTEHLHRMLSAASWASVHRPSVCGRFAVAGSTRPGGRVPPRPVTSSGPVLVTLAGRLHNRLELADLLDVDASATSDTALTERAYARWGEDAISHLRGRFAAAIWDAPNRTLVIARDPMGLVPLYFHVSPDRLVFSSAVASIAALPDVSPELDEARLAAHLLYRRPDLTSTFFSAIRRLRPGHLLAHVNGRVSIRRHYAPTPAPLPGRPSDRDYADALREKIDRAIGAEISADDRVGLHLSGGLDSSALACLAARRLSSSSGAIVAASSVLPVGHIGDETDEASYLAELERDEPALHIELVTAVGLGVVDGLEDAFARLQAPVNVFHYMDRALASALSGLGARVVLHGFGGDAGASYAPRWTGSRWRRLMSPVAWPGVIRQAASRALSAGRPSNPGWSPAARRLLEQYRELPPLNRPRDIAANQFSWLETGAGPAAEELIGFHASLGIDLVVPYYDLELREFLAGVPPRQFSLGGVDRSLFRRAMMGVLPEKIRTRTSKEAYVPDVARRITKERVAHLDWLIRHRGRRAGEVWLDDYLDLDRIVMALHQVRPKVRGDAWSSPAMGTAAAGLIAARFLVWLSRDMGVHRG